MYPMLKNLLHNNHTNKKVEYHIESEFNPMWVVDMETKWSAAKSKILSEMIAANPSCMKDVKEFSKLITKYNLEDLEWNWLAKAIQLNTDEYRWFYLIAEETVQAACIIFHPKQSILDSKNIFYVDYLATAFWNRNRPSYTRQHSSLGTLLLAHSIRFAIEKLSYRPGFCLHSLPQAESYYLGLGMTDCGIDKNKENLKFFEAKETVSLSLMEKNHG